MDRSAAGAPGTDPRRNLAVARQDGVRQHNLGMLLRYLHRNGESTRAEMTALLGLNRSTIRSLVTDLVAAGLVRERRPEPAPAGVGRPSHVVALTAEGPYVVAVDVGVDIVTVAAVGLGGQVIARHRTTLGERDRSPQAVARLIAHRVHRLESTLAPDRWPVGVGVSVPGSVGVGDGTIGLAPNLRWHGVALEKIVSHALEHTLPVHVGNDANLGALAEHRRGSGRGCDDMLYLTGNVGVGAGIILGAVTALGTGGYAGEVGHLVVDADGLPCRCGNIGCLETKVGEPALLRGAGLSPAAGPAGVDAVFDSYQRDDAVARRSVDSAARWLGVGVAALTTVLNPRLVVLGGTLARIYASAPAVVHERVRSRTMTGPLSQVTIRMPELGTDSSLLGAAELAFEPLLARPTDDRQLCGPSGCEPAPDVSSAAPC